MAFRLKGVGSMVLKSNEVGYHGSGMLVDEMDYTVTPDRRLTEMMVGFREVWLFRPGLAVFEDGYGYRATVWRFTDPGSDVYKHWGIIYPPLVDPESVLPGCTLNHEGVLPECFLQAISEVVNRVGDQIKKWNKQTGFDLKREEQFGLELKISFICSADDEMLKPEDFNLTLYAPHGFIKDVVEFTRALVRKINRYMAKA